MAPRSRRAAETGAQGHNGRAGRKEAAWGLGSAHVGAGAGDAAGAGDEDEAVSRQGRKGSRHAQAQKEHLAAAGRGGAAAGYAEEGGSKERRGGVGGALCARAAAKCRSRRPDPSHQGLWPKTDVIASRAGRQSSNEKWVEGAKENLWLIREGSDAAGQTKNTRAHLHRFGYVRKN